MCIGLISTAHPSYPLILLSNRDEYLNRPTLLANWWQEPNAHVLGGRDLKRSVQGTWLGVTEQGRFALLTNFREEDQQAQPDARSRGEIAKSFLTLPPDSQISPKQWVNSILAEGVNGVGGFSLLFGDVRSSQEEHAIGVFSNRTANVRDVTWIEGGDKGQTVGLSNALFGHKGWPKVERGEEFLREIIEMDVLSGGDPKEAIVEQAFDLLSDDTLPAQHPEENLQTYTRELKKSIFIPQIGGLVDADVRPAEDIATGNVDRPPNDTSAVYGTQRQTVILINKQGQVLFEERPVYDDRMRSFGDGKGSRRFEFNLETSDES
ncbi:MAG: hypothetical protein M1828_006123 [Chrysothrix sp. TS-e1954]|nr:MAG: hypothetical protein M1828_006123 [Chrysothrix sp. TS-e1954]